MNVEDYLINPDGKDWSELLSSWVPPLPPSFTVWLVNRFGDLFIVVDDGSVHMLELSAGVITRLADDREDFARKIDLEGNADEWLMILLVDQCVAAGIVLSADQCYSYKIPPILGGVYGVQNVQPADLSVNYSLMADICRQANALPVGTKVSIVLTRH
jgi:Domain of unknown function (DUF1851)